jgi:hypothetical protein
MVLHIGSYPNKTALIAGPTPSIGKFACELKESPHESMSNVRRRPDKCTVCLKKACTQRSQEEKEEFDMVTESIKQKIDISLEQAMKREASV